MADDNAKQTPPYIPYATFENFINGLSEHGVPDQIDSSLMQNLSGSTRSGLMVALRYLNLIDEENNTLAALEKLAKAKDNAARSPLLRDVLMRAYRFLQKEEDGPWLDLSRATPAQLADMIGAEGASGGTRDKAVGFFLKAAELAGIQISPHILKRKYARTAPSTKRAKRTLSKKPKQVTAVEENDSENDDRLPTKKLSELVLALLDAEELPEEVETAIWTLLKYLRKEGK